MIWCKPPTWQLFLESPSLLCLRCTTCLSIILLRLNSSFRNPCQSFYFSFSALSFYNFFSCHFGKLIEHIGFISILDSGKSFLILGTLTFFYLDLAPRISIDDFPTSLPSIARFFSNVISFSIIEFRSKLFFF
jgi:hypothetical protein